MDRRYLLVSADGRHATLGSQVERDEEVLDTAAEGLDAMGDGGLAGAVGGLVRQRSLFATGGYEIRSSRPPC